MIFCIILCVMKLQVITWLKVTCTRQQLEHDSLAKQIKLPNINDIPFPILHSNGEPQVVTNL